MGIYTTVASRAFINHTTTEKSIGDSVAVLLPTYCEVENIEDMIREIEGLGLPNLRIVVIDDSSPDGTCELVRQLQEKYDNIIFYRRPAKLGLGTAITAGFKLILSMKNPPSYVVAMDADFSHDPKEILRLIRAMKNDSDLVIGSRYQQSGEILGWSPVRHAISRVANFIAATVARTKVRDCTSGFRCYSVRYLRSVIKDLHSETYEIQIETVKQARIKKFRISEVPITFTNRKRGKSKLTLTEIQAFLSYIIRARLEIGKASEEFIWSRNLMKLQAQMEEKKTKGFNDTYNHSRLFF